MQQMFKPKTPEVYVVWSLWELATYTENQNYDEVKILLH